MLKSSLVTRRLAAAHPAVFVLYACIAAFMAYACMYGFRKPFTAAAYAGYSLWGIDYKIVLVSAQVFGYALSKFIGIRFISGMTPERRAFALLSLIGVAQLALLGFALTPFPFKAIWLFVNGVPLGMIFGLVFGYLEGRRSTELLAAALSVNFIISSGFVKSVGKNLLLDGVSEWWMPFTAGMYFVPFLLLAVWMLEQMPPPTEADKLARNERKKMSKADRKHLWRKYMPGFLFFTIGYLMLTIIRDVRDNFAVEIWSELGYSGQPAILTTAELPVAALTLIGLGALSLITDNFRAFWINHVLCLGGAVLLVVSTYLFQMQLISPIVWMVLSGFGLFLPYVIFNGVMFDRFLAAYREPGNVGFLIYIADAFGYLGAVVVLIWRNFGFAKVSWLHFYQNLCYIGMGLFALSILIAWAYFLRQKKAMDQVGIEFEHAL
jgi:hypothetical protein